MKIKILVIFLFSCVFLIAGCGIKNSRAEFQEIASKVEMDSDPANVSEFEMYLPKGYIEYIPDSREYKKTTVTLSSGKEKKVICPYAQPGYKKNKLEKRIEYWDEFFKDNSCHYFINYKDEIVLKLYLEPLFTNSEFINQIKHYKPIKDESFKIYFKKYNLSSSDTEIWLVNEKLVDKDFKDIFSFSSKANVVTSTVKVSLEIDYSHSKDFNLNDINGFHDIIAILLSIKPNSTNPVKSDSDDSVKPNSENKCNKEKRNV